MAATSKNPAKPGRAASAAEPKEDVLRVEQSPERSEDRLRAEVGFSPIIGNAVTTRTFAKERFDSLGLTECVEVLREAVDRVHAGNMADIEATLTSQAVALNAMFNELARRAASNTGEYLEATEIYLRLGLKVQAQCRATLETLAEIRNPRPIAFVQQANIANGPQQVNNRRYPTCPRVRARELRQNRRTNYWRRIMANGWTPERRASQAARIDEWKPWLGSTGPTTEPGKAISAMNARKHGMRGRAARNQARSLRYLIRACTRWHEKPDEPDPGCLSDRS